MMWTRCPTVMGISSPTVRLASNIRCSHSLINKRWSQKVHKVHTVSYLSIHPKRPLPLLPCTPIHLIHAHTFQPCDALRGVRQQPRVVDPGPVGLRCQVLNGFPRTRAWET